MSLTRLDFARRRRATLALVACAAIALLARAPAAAAAQRTSDRRLQTRLEEAGRKESEALLTMVDAAMAGRAIPSGFSIAWRNDFLKANPGTLVPFTVTIDPSLVSAPSALMYVRTARRGAPATPVPEARGTFSRYAFDAIFPVELKAEPGQPIRITRGFVVPPGEYDVYIAVRERPADPLAGERRSLKSGLLKQSISVPDFWSGSITTSTIMLANRIDTLQGPVPPDELLEHPYAVGQQEIVPEPGSRFRRDSELIVVFLIYNQQITQDSGFDVTVDYHVFRRRAPDPGEPADPAPDHPPARPGERYLTRTTPQRFNPATMGGTFDRAAAQPVMAGQGILLSSFEEGDYRIGITVTDLLSRTSVSRDVTFTVVGS